MQKTKMCQMCTGYCYCLLPCCKQQTKQHTNNQPYITWYCCIAHYHCIAGLANVKTKSKKQHLCQTFTDYCYHVQHTSNKQTIAQHCHVAHCHVASGIVVLYERKMPKQETSNICVNSIQIVVVIICCCASNK